MTQATLGRILAEPARPRHNVLARSAMVIGGLAIEEGSRRLRVSDGAVHIWRERLGEGDPRERREASRAGLRILLGRYLDRDPSQVTFVRGAFGKPRLAAGFDDGALQFSLSRSGDRCLIAVTRMGSIGVDVERLEPFADLHGVAARLFSPAEAASIASARDARRTRLFYDCWTRREAYVKAVGSGVNVTFDSFSVSLGDDNEPSIVHSARGDAAEWSVHSLRPWHDCVAAVVVRRGSFEPVLTVNDMDVR